MTLDRSIGPRCNIGPQEVARRRRSAIAMTVAVAIAAIVMVVVAVPAPVRLLLWPLATAAAVTWLQVVHRFCVAFGAIGLENFGRLGHESPVDPGIRAADRRRAVLLILEGAAIGLFVAVVLAAVPV